MPEQSDEQQDHTGLAVGAGIGVVLAVLLWLAIVSVVQNVTAGGPAYVGNLKFVLPQPTLEVVVSLVVGTWLAIKRPPLAVVLKWTCLVAWIFVAVNVLSIISLGFLGAF